MPASWATSWRRSPGVRRRPGSPASGRPAWRGLSRARLARRNAARSARLVEFISVILAAAAARKVVLPVPGMSGLSRAAAVTPNARLIATTIALVTGSNKEKGFETARQLGSRGSPVLAGVRDEARGMQA